MAKNKTSGSAEFDKLRNRMAADRALRNEVRDSLFAMTEQINVSDRGSRFVAGGTVEWIVASACYAAEVIAIPEGHNANGFDLTGVNATVKGLFSVKSSLSPTSAFRITNGINGAGKGFVEPTIFLHKRLGGLVFADPAIHTELAGRAEQKADAVVLSLKAIIEHAQQRPECVIDLEIPYNQGRGTYDPALSFAKALITDGNYPNLKRLFEEVKPQTSTISEEIGKLKQLRDDGVLNQVQFERAVDRLLKG
ncbi:SHOCT domain-containing protein [Nocardioides mesophilus]|uniref:SHOCT domain-containing protein n=1 Tax=Nocardioides mesophilus TaxID=433659 RepID=A0A7G9RD93_9ACTN|nr:SHOCT domain-containing protein [Nocardioides mesophilus]QNN53568.1 SHOCT domain-containing protein [Nocardioides mesophilus]